MATLNFPDAPDTGDIYTDSNSGFTYEWNGTVWISKDPSTASNIREIDNISGSFNGSTTAFTLQVAGVNVEPANVQQLIISVGGVMQNAGDDYTVSGSTLTFTTAPTSGLTFFGTLLGTALSLNTVADGSVSPASLTTTSNYMMGGLTVDQNAGIITAYQFQGDGSGLTGVASTDNIITSYGATFLSNVRVAGIFTAANAYVTGILTAQTLNYNNVVDIYSTGIITATRGIQQTGNEGLHVSSGITTVGIFTATSARVGLGVTINNTGIDAGNAGIVTAGTVAAPSALTLKYGGTTSAATIDTSGRFLIGTTSGRSCGGVNAQSQVEGTSFATASLNLIANSGASAGNVAHFTLAKSRGTADGESTIVADGDVLGTIQFVGADGVDLANVAAHIQSKVDGTPGADDMPGSLVFATTADGGTAPTERLKITSAGSFQFTNGGLIENATITADKLSSLGNPAAIDVANGMVRYFTTNETTSTTMNLRFNSSTALNDVMDTGDVINMTVILTPNGAGYIDGLDIDGTGNSSNVVWPDGGQSGANGFPDSGGASGIDVYAFTIIKTGNNTWKPIANYNNFS